MERRAFRVVMALSVLISMGAAVGSHSRSAEAADRAPMVLAVDVSKPYKRVDHAASGALYGLGDEGWPADRQPVSYDPTQFREMIRQTTVTVPLPRGTSTITLAKSTQPGTVDLDYIDVSVA